MDKLEKRRFYLEYLESINESKSREKKLQKQREKIYKFLNVDYIIDYIFDNVVSNDSTKGLKYTIWFANAIKEKFKEDLLENKDKLSKLLNIDIDENFLNDYFLNYETKKSTNDVFFKTAFHFKDIFYDIVSYGGDSEYDLKMRTIVDWLKSPLRENEEINLSEYTFDQAYEEAQEWHDNLKATGIIEDETGKILKTYDDGWYWIDLETTDCKAEGEAMGHCGVTTESDTMWSLRKNKSPHVTMAVNTNTNTITQIKGRNNKKPIEKYHSYIVDIILDSGLKRFEYEYDTGDDFRIDDLNDELYEKLLSVYPELLQEKSSIDRFINLFKDKLDLFINKFDSDVLIKIILNKTLQDDVKTYHKIIKSLKNKEIFPNVIIDNEKIKFINLSQHEYIYLLLKISFKFPKNSYFYKKMDQDTILNKIFNKSNLIFFSESIYNTIDYKLVSDNVIDILLKNKQNKNLIEKLNKEYIFILKEKMKQESENFKKYLKSIEITVTKNSYEIDFYRFISYLTEENSHISHYNFDNYWQTNNKKLGTYYVSYNFIQDYNDFLLKKLNELK